MFTEKKVFCTLQKPFPYIVQLFASICANEQSSAVQSFKQDQVAIYDAFFETFLCEDFLISGTVQGGSRRPGLRSEGKVYGLHSLHSGGITSAVKNDDSKVVSERP